LINVVSSHDARTAAFLENLNWYDPTGSSLHCMGLRQDLPQRESVVQRRRT